MTLSDKLSSRRSLIKAGGTGLTAVGLLALANVSTPAYAKSKKMPDGAQDANLLNAAVALEHEGIAAYEIALGSGLLPADAAGVARAFQDHHKQHNEQLFAAVRRLGGEPATAKTIAQYAEDLEASKLKSAADILKFAFGLERGAASAYLGLVEPLKGGEFKALVAKLAADESYHVGFFNAALKEAIPATAPLF